MPEMSGFDVQAVLARDHPAAPIVVMTGHDTPESHVRAVQLGAKVYLCKPINDETLLAAIGDAIDGVRLNLPAYDVVSARNAPSARGETT